MEEAMRNADGKYVATRYMNQTGTLLTGVGETIEEARFLLKNELKKYREGLLAGVYLLATGDTVRSPGSSFERNDSGSVRLSHDENREMPIMARPEVAKYVQAGRKDNVLKETRQIRRARERG
jgi:hypothetical protein